MCRAGRDQCSETGLLFSTEARRSNPVHHTTGSRCVGEVVDRRVIPAFYPMVVSFGMGAMRTDPVVDGQSGRHVSKSVRGDSVRRKSAYGVRAFYCEGSFNVRRRGEPLVGDSQSRARLARGPSANPMAVKSLTLNRL